MATAAAIAYTASLDAVQARGHRIKKAALPLVVADDVEAVSKTSELESFFEKAGLSEEMRRLYSGIKRNAGRSRLRGRVYDQRVGPLIVVTNDRGVGKAAGSMPGVDVIMVDSLSVLDLAPGGVPGRLTLWTESALGALSAPAQEVAPIAA